jgi:Holliday junction resolvase RusA-like endonuclease
VTALSPATSNAQVPRGIVGAWSQEAMLALRSQDWRILPPGDYAAELEVTTYGQRDVDNPLEAVLDLIQSALELDDRRIERLHARRLDAAADEARIELRLLIWEQ